MNAYEYKVIDMHSGVDIKIKSKVSDNFAEIVYQIVQECTTAISLKDVKDYLGNLLDSRLEYTISDLDEYIERASLKSTNS